MSATIHQLNISRGGVPKRATPEGRVTKEGLDWAQLEPGMRLRLGEKVLIELQRYATPCATIAGSFIDGDIMLLSHVTAPGQSRLYASVLE